MKNKLKDLPYFERPRERLIEIGVKNLSDIELLAIVLKSGTKKESVLELAKKLIIKYKTINNLNNITYHELVKISGIKKAKASSILASIELGRRMFIFKDKKKIIKDRDDIYHLMRPYVNNLDYENFYVISLNAKSSVLSVDKISTGKSSSVSIDIPSIFKVAIKNNATSIIILHNHPSGISKPSREDFLVTERIIKASNVINVDVLDHIIVGNLEYYSFSKNKISYIKE